MLGISNKKFASIIFLLFAILIALFIGSYTTFFTSYQHAALPNLGSNHIFEGMTITTPPSKQKNPPSNKK
jgi:hypothetical protein